MLINVIQLSERIACKFSFFSSFQKQNKKLMRFLPRAQNYESVASFFSPKRIRIFPAWNSISPILIHINIFLFSHTFFRYSVLCCYSKSGCLWVTSCGDHTNRRLRFKRFVSPEFIDFGQSNLPPKKRMWKKKKKQQSNTMLDDTYNRISSDTSHLFYSRHMKY